ncbi:MAG TPA: hypothetical protein VGV41_12505 [Pseudolabrys sp.]|uniref:hypothetical protein n=1 Tax=Pseudolabrys sp. TaxID=1960880 RepID=UPI002DDD96C2|nr:hypothetical protein [Pseudolabrys sp.]HEV2629452.1 hypothetical protein [Pseudolabrys sp.]
MPNQPEQSEAEALNRAGGLLRFAAENSQLSEDIVGPICAAWDARQNNAWTQAVAVKFWIAFNSLCTLVKPVTMDSLSTNLKEVPPPSWLRPWKPHPISLSKRTADHYLILLVVLLLLAVVFAFLQSKVGDFAKQIKTQIDLADKLVVQMTTNVDSLDKDGIFDLRDVRPGNLATVSLLQQQFQELSYLEEQMLQERHVISALSTLGFGTYPYAPGTYEPAATAYEIRASLANYKDVRRKVNSYLLHEGLAIEIISSSVLPIVLGLMGACAYVVRLISDQIKDATFSTTSPIRHRVRLLLGGLAGIVIGFGGIVTSAGLSSAALAFIAGYSIEPVFATLDSIASKFRR